MSASFLTLMYLYFTVPLTKWEIIILENKTKQDTLELIWANHCDERKEPLLPAHICQVKEIKSCIHKASSSSEELKEIIFQTLNTLATGGYFSFILTLCFIVCPNPGGWLESLFPLLCSLQINVVLKCACGFPPPFVLPLLFLESFTISLIFFPGDGTELYSWRIVLLLMFFLIHLSFPLKPGWGTFPNLGGGGKIIHWEDNDFF